MAQSLLLEDALNFANEVIVTIGIVKKTDVKKTPTSNGCGWKLRALKSNNHIPVCLYSLPATN